MIKKIFFLLLLSSFSATAQFFISGEFIPSDGTNWAILYRMESGKGVFVDQSDVINGKFKFSLDQGSPSGMYRIMFQADQQKYIDLIFNNENISLKLNPEHPRESLEFINSDENILYQEYLQTIRKEQKKLDSIQKLYFVSKDPVLKNAYQEQYEIVNQVQTDFERKSTGKTAHHFIKAKKQFNPEIPEISPQAQLRTLRNRYFDTLDFNDEVLTNSSVFYNKLFDYIFELNVSKSLEKTEILQKFAIEEIIDKIAQNYPVLQHFEESIIRIYLKKNNPKMARYVLDKYYLKLPARYIDPVFKESILGNLKTATGSKCPDLQWKENGKIQSLYNLKNKDYYIIVFFSSGCSHCQEQMPVFYEAVKSLKNVQVITVGLEDDKDWWQEMTSHWKEFINILDLKKWEGNRVKEFGVTSIPTYFVLDRNKIILAKPDDVYELKKIFKLR